MDSETTMDHAEVIARQVVDRYLLGQLDDEEAQRFERHYLRCDECLNQLEVTEELVEGLRTAAAEDVARTAISVGWAARLARFGAPARFGAWALFVLILLAPTAYFYGRLVAVKSQLASAQGPQAALAVLPLNPLRAAGGEPSRQIQLGSADGWVVLSLEIGEATGGPYLIRLRNEAGEEVWRGRDLLSGEQGDIHLHLHSDFLSPGIYSIEVGETSGGGASVPVARFRFRVLRG